MLALSVVELASYIQQLLESDPILGDVWVRGEVSNWSRSAAGHCYWTLREGDSQLRAVCFRQQAERQRELPANGQEILARGHVSFWMASGQIQFYVDLIQPAGVGLLHAQVEALKQRLAAEGLFDEARKRSLPAMPQRIGIVTSPTGAALQDMLTILQRRWPLCEVILSPSLVQGDEAPYSLVEALFNLYDHRPDVIIVARGGGSIEDLWAFNDESVVRAVAAAPVPIITGVGHETDTTVVDYVADLRAATPSAAAVLATPDIVDLRDSLAIAREELETTMRRKLADASAELVDRTARLRRLSPRRQLVDGQLRVDQLTGRLYQALRHKMLWEARGLAGIQRSLEALNPRATLARGYAIVRRLDGNVVLSATDVEAGERLLLEVRDGVIGARVDDR